MAGRIRTYPLNIKAGSKDEYGMPGNVVRVVSSSVRLYFEIKGGDSGFYLDQGESAEFDNEAFTALTVYHTDAANQDIVLAISSDAKISSLKVSGLVTVVSAAPARGTGANSNPAVTNASASLLAANVNRNYLLIQNKDPAGDIYISFGGAATVANGVKIAAGGSYELDSNILTAQIFAIGSIANNPNVVVVEG